MGPKIHEQEGHDLSTPLGRRKFSASETLRYLESAYCNGADRENVVDALADLLHYGFDVEDALGIAHRHFRAETAEAKRDNLPEEPADPIERARCK